MLVQLDLYFRDCTTERCWPLVMTIRWLDIAILFRGGRHRRQRPRTPAEEPDAVVSDVLELEAAIDALLSSR